MSLYRCAACGSPRVTTDTQEKSSGYSFKKGALGAFLFGTGGAVAGINGKTQIETIYKCPDCGLTLNHCMGSYEKREIEKILSAPRKSLLSAQELEAWEVLYKKKYANLGECAFERNETREIQNVVNARSSVSEAQFVQLAKSIASFMEKIGWFDNRFPPYSLWEEPRPSPKEYREFCQNVHTFIHHIPTYKSYYSKQSFMSSANWQKLITPMYLDRLIIFNIIMEYYEKTHSKIPDDVFGKTYTAESEAVATNYFYKENPHLKQIAIDAGVISDFPQRAGCGFVSGRLIEFGGDLYSVYQISPQKYCFMVVDESGNMKMIE